MWAASECVSFANEKTHVCLERQPTSRSQQATRRCELLASWQGSSDGAAAGRRHARLCGFAQAPRVQPGLQHAVLDEHEVCRRGRRHGCSWWRHAGRDSAGPSSSAAHHSAAMHTTQRQWQLQAGHAAPLPALAPLRRSCGVESTTACRSSLRVQTTMGPSARPPDTGSPRRTTASAPPPMAASAAPTRPPPTIVKGCVMVCCCALAVVTTQRLRAAAGVAVRRGAGRLGWRRGAAAL